MIDVWTKDDPWPNDTHELLLIGPPGTGKTSSVLWSYVWPAMREDKVVLATSFTCAAAEELRKRTAKEFGKQPSVYREELSTMHSEAARRCRHMGFQLGEREDTATVEDESEDREPSIVARIEEEASRSGLAAWDRTRAMYPEDIGLPVEARLQRAGLYGHRLDDAVVAVNRHLHHQHRDGVLVRPDFTSLLEQALLYGKSRRLDLLVVDEVQDTCPLQWALIDRWAQTADRILFVGDPDQSIYGWAGADGQRLLSWIRAGRCTRRLAQSYRVPVAAHRFARTVIGQVYDREDAPYHPKVDKETQIPIEGTIREEYGDEAWFAVGAAQEARDTAFVLSRTCKGVAAAAADLERMSIPHITERGRSLLGNPVKPSRTYRIVEALRDVAERQPLRADGARALVSAFHAAMMLDVLPRGAKGEMTAMLKGKQSRVQIDTLEDAGFPTEAMTGMWRGLAYNERKGLLQPAPVDEAARCFLASVVSAPDMLTVARWLAAYGDDLLARASLVRVTTAHGSKGREAKVVVIDARHRIASRMTPEETDEDRRILYVAATRTERDLVILRDCDEDWLHMHGLAIEPS